MWCLETLNKLNDPSYALPEPHPLRYHPRILSVRRFVNGMPVPYQYKMRLKRSIYLYADQIISRPVYAPGEGWSDEEAIQQVTLSDWNEESLRRMIGIKSELEEILSYKTGWGSIERVGLSPDGSEELHRFSHASAMGSLLERYKYGEVFKKPIPKIVQRFHPVIIAKLCGYARKVAVDLETLLSKNSED